MSISNSSEVFSKRLEAYSKLAQLSAASYIPALVVPGTDVDNEEQIVNALSVRARDIGDFLEAYAGFIPDDVSDLTIEAGGVIKGNLWYMAQEPMTELRLLRYDHAYSRSSSKLGEAAHRMKRYVSHLSGEMGNAYVPEPRDRSEEFLENELLSQREDELRAAGSVSVEAIEEQKPPNR